MSYEILKIFHTFPVGGENLIYFPQITNIPDKFFKGMLSMKNVYNEHDTHLARHNLIKISPFISLSICFCRLWKATNGERDERAIFN